MHDITTIYEELTDQQRAGAVLAAMGYTCKEISSKLNVRQETVSRWKQLPHYQELVYITAEESRQAMVSRMDDLLGKAMDALEATLSRWDDPKLRLTAAIKILEIGISNKSLSSSFTNSS